MTREYYINDALNSTQMNNFGKSVFVRYRQLLGHPGGEPSPICTAASTSQMSRAPSLPRTAKRFEGERIDDPQTVSTFRELSEAGMVTQQKADLEAFGVRFDSWFREVNSLHAD